MSPREKKQNKSSDDDDSMMMIPRASSNHLVKNFDLNHSNDDDDDSMIMMIRRGNSKKPMPEETEEDDHHMVSDNAATILNLKVASVDDRLGFDELGYFFYGSHDTVSSLGYCAASKASRDVGVSDSSLLDPLTLGFSCGDHLDPLPANEDAWDLCRMDLEFSSILFPGYDPPPPQII